MLLTSTGSHGEFSSVMVPLLSESPTMDPREPTCHGDVSRVDMEALIEDATIDIDVDEDHSQLNSEQPQCRICLDTEGEDFIAPCHCKGTQKYVHRSCLDNWRSIKEGFAFSHCTECRAQFLLRANSPSDRMWSKLKFQLLVARDHAFIIIIMQLIMAMVGLVMYKIYGEELREIFGYEDHPYGFYVIAVLVILTVGLLYGFFIALLFGQKINERHYHVLAKKKLAKEFVVEDREKNGDLPELDPSYVLELRLFGLFD